MTASNVKIREILIAEIRAPISDLSFEIWDDITDHFVCF